MIRDLSAPALTTLLVLFLPRSLGAQPHAMEPDAARHWLSLVEIPVLATAVVFGFLTARALRGGRLGTGMRLIAWGFLVMAVGHLSMQIEALTGVSPIAALLGRRGGQAAWVVALVATWTLTATGFYRLYRASVQA